MLYRNSPAFTVTASDDLFNDPPLALGIDSMLHELPLHTASLSFQSLGAEAARLFESEPELPGVMLIEQDNVGGILSRQRFLEYLLHPHGCELFLAQPLAVLYSYARLKPLCLPENTPILVAAQAALRRPIELQGEPILVKHSQGDRLLNAHDLNLAHWHIRGIETQVRHERTQAYMLQNQKMAALGRLVDGVSHEILDPLSFIWGNLTHLSRYCQHLLDLVATYEGVLEAQAITHPQVQDLSEAIELDYLREDLPHTIRSIQSGAERLKQLASSLQNFCHIDEVYPKPADLHELIDSIVLLLKSRLNTRIQINRNYAALPPVTCFSGHLSQVFMNILTHCIDALLAKAARHHLSADLGLPGTQIRLMDSTAAPTITITTQLCSAPQGPGPGSDRWVAITISDNGPGLSPEAQQQVLNSFSIEQRLARETDLATSYRIITAKHGGKFYVRSRTFSEQETAPGIGTEFEIRLPLHLATSSL